MISVILPVYNAGNFLKETIASILGQTEKNIELIIINDGSTDNSEEIILGFDDERIRYVKHDENKGVASAFNEGLKLANGDFITFHGADDVSLPNRFERLLAEFCCENIGYVHSDMLLITENNSPFNYWQAGNISPKDIYSFFLNVGTPFNNGSMVFRKKAVKDIFYEESIKVGSDTDYVLKIAKEQWHSSHVPEPLYLYRRHQTNVTNTKSYEDLAKHIRLNITDEDLKTLSEVQGKSEENKLFIAKLIAGLALTRRWMQLEGFTLFREAIPFIKTERDLLFYEGMKGLVEKNYNHAVTHFQKISDRDHIEENYLGEALLHLKKYNEAYAHFLRALQLSPNYHTPVKNLKVIGILRGHNLIDKYVQPFK